MKWIKNIFGEKEKCNKLIAQYELLKDIPNMKQGEVINLYEHEYKMNPIQISAVVQMESNKKYFKKLTD